MRFLSLRLILLLINYGDLVGPGSHINECNWSMESKLPNWICDPLELNVLPFIIISVVQFKVHFFCRFRFGMKYKQGSPSCGASTSCPLIVFWQSNNIENFFFFWRASASSVHVVASALSSLTSVGTFQQAGSNWRWNMFPPFGPFLLRVSYLF